MAESEQQFLTRLREAFAQEAEEHLAAMSDGLLELEKGSPSDRGVKVIETIFREAHSLKGAARAVNFADIEAICQAMESVFSVWKRGDLSPSRQLFDTLQRSTDIIGKLLKLQASAEPADVTKLTQELSDLRIAASVPKPLPTPPAASTAEPQTESPAAPAPPPESPTPAAIPVAAATMSEISSAIPSDEPSLPSPASETVRIAAAKLDRLFLEAEEMLGIKLAVNQRTADLVALRMTLDPWRKQWAKVATELHALRQRASQSSTLPTREHAPSDIAPLLEYCETSVAVFKSVDEKLRLLVRACDHDRRSTASMVDSLLENVKQVLMVPFSTFLRVVPKLVRDLARDQGKEVDLVIRGGEVEIDRRILEEMRDPLTHLLRNAVDHGIESPAVRTAKGKPAHGSVTIAVSQSQGKVEILVADDGAGIDAGDVREACVRAGVTVDSNATDDEQAAVQLIFQSGVSTSRIITDVSGRGLGMAIVREKVEKLGGQIVTSTRVSGGSSFRLLLPLTLATFRGVLVQANDRQFVVPTAHVDRVVRVKPDDVKRVEGRETILVGGRPVAFARLGDVLDLGQATVPVESEKLIAAIVVVTGEKRVAFGVDAVVGEQEVLVKGLGKRLRRVRNVSAATVLGSGKVVPILDAADLIESASRAAGDSAARPKAGGEKAVRKSVLIAEDSITSRILLKNICESAGYRATTAIDGADAFATLKSDSFDVVISDVEMPRMNGFELTERIRADAKLAKLPVVLVTSLESREDRERGIDAGADAYILKSRFDQSNLLEVVRKLV